MSRATVVMPYYQTGNLVTSTLWNVGPKNFNDFFSNRPLFNGLCTTANSIADNTWTAIPFNSNSIDTDGGHNTAVNNTRYTSQYSAWYWVKGSVAFAPTGVASRFESAIAVNGSTYAGASEFVMKQASDLASCSASALVRLTAGSYVEIWCRQHTGGAVNLDATNTAPDMNVMFVSN